MTNIVKLPPEFISGNEIPVSVATIKRERMEEILREAVEADRQQRGEPFMYLRTLNGKPDWSEDCVADCESDLIHDEEMYAEGYGVMPLYTAPQPATPAQEPSDELEMFETWFLASNPSWEITPQEKRSGTYVFERANIQWVAWQARALLARYGQPTTPAGSQSAWKGPTDDMVSVIEWVDGVGFQIMRKSAPKFGEEG